MMSDFTKFLIRLKIYRAGLGFTQQDIAKNLNLSLRTYQRIEQGVAPLEVEKVHQISELFQIPYSQLTEPAYSDQEPSHIKFFDSYSEVLDYIGPDLNDKVKGLDDLTEYFLSHLQEGTTISKLVKTPQFKNNDYGYFFSNPTFSWLNPALIKRFSPQYPVKIPVVKNVENLEEIIQVWELSIKNRKKWYISENEIKDTSGQMISHTICKFNLHEGLPFVVGHIYKVTPKEL